MLLSDKQICLNDGVVRGVHRQSSDSSCSILSTVTATPSDKKDGAAPSPPKRRVQIKEECNVYYDNPYSIKSLQSRWYNRKELTDLRKDTLRAIEKLKFATESMDEVTGWGKSINRIYRGFCDSDSARNIMPLTSYDSTLVTYALGLEKRIVPGYNKDRRSRRVQILSRIQFWYQQTNLSDKSKDAKIWQVSRSWSKPNRLFAQHNGFLCAYYVRKEASEDYPPQGRDATC